MGVLYKGRSMLLHIHCQLDLSGKLQSFCLQHANTVCMHSKSGAFWKCQTCYTVQINWMAYHSSLWCSPDSSDLMLMHALEQKHIEFCAETWKRSLALLRQERVCDRKQTKGREVQSYTRTGRRNKNLTLGSVLSKRTAKASEKESVSLNFVFGQKRGQ